MDNISTELDTVSMRDLLSEGTSRYITEINAINGGGQIIYKFPNGYGASVVKHLFSYGASQGLFELAIFDTDGYITFDTPITDDLIGYLTPAEVDMVLIKIKNLCPSTT